MSEEVVVRVEQAHLSFPMQRFRAAGLKEAFLAKILGRSPKTEERYFWALKGVSLEVPKGQIVGMIGKNGSGKSTFVRLVSGIYAPDRGKVSTVGRIAMLQLGSGFKDELTGYENVKLSGAIMGLSSAEVEARAESIIEFAGVGEHILQPLRTYSSGMRARLGFAVASAVDPDILLMDEVFAVGDAEFRDKCMARIKEMVAGETTVLVISHNMAAIRQLCERVVWLSRGEVVRDGMPDEVIPLYEELRGERPD